MNDEINTHSNSRSCISLISAKEVLSSYEEFRSHLSNNIVKHSWNEDFDEIAGSLEGEDGDKGSQCEGEEESTSNDVTSSDIQIQNSCSEAISRLERLKKPIIRKQDRGRKIFQCTQCDYSCAQSSDLKKHMRVHTGEKPFQCSQCDYSCAQSTNLKQHVRIHTGEKPYTCTQCDYSCAHSSTLKNHMRVHTGEQP